MPMSRAHKNQLRGTKMQGHVKPLTASKGKKTATEPKRRGGRKK